MADFIRFFSYGDRVISIMAKNFRFYLFSLSSFFVTPTILCSTLKNFSIPF